MRDCMMFVLAAVVSFIFVPAAQAQGVWSGECTQAKPCAAIADPPAEAVSCTLNGLPSGASEKPVVDRSSITPALPAAANVQARTCYWPGIVLPPGTYNLTATVKDAGGRSSATTSPLSVTVLTPLAPPSGLRLGTW
jgi:hypothetical protein